MAGMTPAEEARRPEAPPAAPFKAPEEQSRAELLETLRDAEREHIKTRDLYYRLLKEQGQARKDSELTARRTYEDQFSTYARYAVMRLTGSAWRLATLVEELRDKPTPSAISALRLVAAEVRQELHREPDAGYVDELRDEIKRLRLLITTHARSSHPHDYAAPHEGRRDCEGCELIRAMDDVADPASRQGADPGTDAAPSISGTVSS
jgi:hypothetical protein